jgi:hypothetical protein
MARRPIGMTRGRVLLLAVLRVTTAYAVSMRCRVYRQRIVDWANGYRLPNPEARAALEREYRIPADAWSTPFAKRPR